MREHLCILHCRMHLGKVQWNKIQKNKWENVSGFFVIVPERISGKIQRNKINEVKLKKKKASLESWKRGTLKIQKHQEWRYFSTSRERSSIADVYVTECTYTLDVGSSQESVLSLPLL